MMDVKKVRVKLGERGYEILVGVELLDRFDAFLPAVSWAKAAIITDRNVGPLYAETVGGCLARAGLDVVKAEVPAGEKSKSAEAALEVLDFLIESGMTRSDLVVALGGGVVGDLAGFAASVFKRGVDLIQVPTTLIAQVDSAIGGKTGIDVPRAKNLIGTFHQPLAVLSDVEALKTLEEREFTSGLAEVAKYGFLSPDDWPEPLDKLTRGLRERDDATLVSTVAGCSRAKAEAVSADEYDRGARAILNYGHTLGHALEAASGYAGAYTHGEAVAIGMVYAAVVAEEMEVSAPGLAKRHRDTLGSLGLPVRPEGGAPVFGTLLDAMLLDKKSRGDLTMVLLEAEGRAVVRRGLEEALLERCYEKLLRGG